MSQVRTRRRWRWLIVIGAAAVLVVALRTVITAPPAAPEVSDSVPSRLVVIGLEGRTRPDATDRAVIDRAEADGRSVQVGAMSIRSRYLGACAAAGWATLGAGRRTDVGGLCDVRVTGSSVAGFPARQRAAAANWGDARLGTLSATASAGGGGCVAAVGPGAALAAARPDGTVPEYLSVGTYMAGGYASPCPVTIVDPGRQADQVIAAAARLPDTAVIVSGIGPAAGSTDPALQVIYRLG
ncbi:MAG: hypothetical protein J2P23_11590, partial [Microlunatus sp.]|nr:hypothetical protein [Microlunatus sp.]